MLRFQAEFTNMLVFLTEITELLNLRQGDQFACRWNWLITDELRFKNVQKILYKCIDLI